MAQATAPLSFERTFDPRTGEPVEVAPDVVRVTAPNGGPFTFTGTNSFILGRGRVAIVDPGPDDGRHLAALLAAVGGRPVDAIILTHTHRDHCALVPRLRAETGAPVWFEGRHWPSRPRRPLERDWVGDESAGALVPDRQLADGESVELDGMLLEVVATPGHCANHLCFGIAGTDALLSGDHVMGWNSTMIAVPDGSMADYLESLKKVTALPFRRFLPAHGGPIEDGPAFAAALLRHRQLRNQQIVRAVAGGARGIGDLLRTIYPGLALPLVPAARMTLLAHTEYLAANGRIGLRHGLFGPVLSPAA